MSQKEPERNASYLTGILEAVNQAASAASDSIKETENARLAMTRARGHRDATFRNLEHVRAELTYLAAVLDAAEDWYFMMARDDVPDDENAELSDALFHALHSWLGVLLA